MNNRQSHSTDQMVSNSNGNLFLENEMQIIQTEQPRFSKKSQLGVIVVTWRLVIGAILLFLLSCLIVGLIVHFSTKRKYRSDNSISSLVIDNWDQPYSGPQTKSDKNLNQGVQTYKIPLELYALNRKRLCDKLKDVNLVKGVGVLLQGGDQTSRYNTDTGVLFRQESFFAWTFGVVEPGFYGAIELETCRAFLFIPKLHWSYIIWSGKILKPNDYKEMYQVDEVHYVEELAETLRDKSITDLLVLSGLNTDSDKPFIPAFFEGVEKFKVDNSTLYPIMADLRVIKTDLELEVLRYVAQITSEAHKIMMKSMKAGLYEYQMESIFKHYTYIKGGMRHSAYSAIASSGHNSAVLHYGHASEPNSRRMKDGDMVLFDMGGEYFFYGADVTTSYPVNGKFSAQQKLIYNAVLKANRAVHDKAKPGVWWVDMHKLAEREILKELKTGGLLQGDVDRMMELRLGYTFMPHGLGHLLGLDVHDVGGYPNGTERIDLPGLNKLRTARHLEAGMYLTIEPGCYFIDYLLDSALANSTLASFLVKKEIEKYRKFGGVRIEDSVVIRKWGVESFTDVPRTVKEIENFMNS